MVAAATVFAMDAARAWGSEAHQAIAMAAESMLTSEARSRVDRLLATEPGSTLQSISTWPDERRNPVTSRWHYINFPLDSCRYEAERDCADGACVIEAIKRQTAILRDGATDIQRLSALKYIVHLVADVHQPLHAGFVHDRGGNDYQVQALGRGTNLHALWDTGIVAAIEPDAERLSQQLLAASENSVAGGHEDIGQKAATESCQQVRESWFYPARKPDADYMQHARQIATVRMQLAARRLARLLNETLR